VNGHNHIVNHHQVDGIHYFESSHTGATYGPYRRLADGSWAPEPFGHQSRLLISEPGAGYFSTLQTAGSGKLEIFRVDPQNPGAGDFVQQCLLGFHRQS